MVKPFEIAVGGQADGVARPDHQGGEGLLLGAAGGRRGGRKDVGVGHPLDVAAGDPLVSGAGDRTPDPG